MNSTGIDAIILAAGRGSRLGKLGQKIPKGFVEIGGTTLIERSVADLRNAGVKTITIVIGYRRKHYVDRFGASSDIRLVVNEKYNETGSFESLRLGMAGTAPSSLVLESDIIYESKALMALLSAQEEAVVLASGFTNSGDEVWVTAEDRVLTNLSKHYPKNGAGLVGEFVGISRINSTFKCQLENLHAVAKENWPVEDYERAFVEVGKKTPLHVTLLENLLWGEVDTVKQTRRVETLFATKERAQNE